MILNPARLAALLLAVASVPAFAENVAVVNGKPISSARLDAVVKQVVAQYRGQVADSPQLRNTLKEKLIDNEVLAQEADRLKLGDTPEVKNQVEIERQNIMLTALAADFVKKHPIPDSEVAAEYAKYQAEIGDKEYHIRHILVEKEDEAKALIAKLDAGAKFEELAKQSKDGESAGSGGDLGWVVPSRVEKSLDKNFADAMLMLPKGKYSSTPVKSQYGYHVIKLDDVRPAKVPSLEEVKPQIVSALQQKKFVEYGESLRKKAKITQ